MTVQQPARRAGQFVLAGLTRFSRTKTVPFFVSPRYVFHGLIVLIAAVIAASGLERAPASQPTGWDGQLLALGPLTVRTYGDQSLYVRTPPVLFTNPGRPQSELPIDDPRADVVRSRVRIVEQPAPAPPPPAPPRTETIAYIVQPSDHLRGIAERFGIDVAALVAANGLEDPDALTVGQELLVPPTSGILYTVRPGDTLLGIALDYGVGVDDIMDWRPNGLTDPGLIRVGQRLFVPGGRLGADPPRPRPVARGNRPPSTRLTAPGRFVWPTYGPITTYFMQGGHAGIDIAPSYGTPVRAAAAGRVVEARKLGWSYGWYLVVDHGGGLRTLYAHLSRFLVDHGDQVEAGETIGLVGSTGRSTGPHLHFEVYVNGTLVNPLRYLP